MQIRRPNTEVKRGDEFLSSCSQYRTSRTKLHSACWLAGTPPEMPFVSVCMSKTESKSEVQIRFCWFFSGPFWTGHDTTCIKECVRAIDHVVFSKGMPVGELGRSHSRLCSLAALWSKCPGLAKGGGRYRIDAWPLASVPANIPLDMQLRLARIAS